MEEGQLEATLKDKEQPDTQDCGSWQLVTCSNRQHSSSEPTGLQLKKKHEVLALDKKEPIPMAGEAKSCTTRCGRTETIATKRK